MAPARWIGSPRGVVALLAAAGLCGCSSGDEHGSAPGTGGHASIAAGGAGVSAAGGPASPTSASGGANSSGGAAMSGIGGGVTNGGNGATSHAGGTAAATSMTAGSGGSSGATGSSGGAPSGGGGSSTNAGASTTGPSGGQTGAAGAAPMGTPTLYWLDVSGKVERSDVAKFAADTIVPSAGQGSDGIAVDLAGGHIYWTDMGVPADNDGSIERSDLDGSNVTTIVPTAGTYTPKQLKLEPTEQKLYWSDREGMRVMRANLDGSDIETLYTSGQTDTDRQDTSRWCVGIALDVAGGYFYWSQKGDDDGHTGSLRRAHLAVPDGQTSVTRTDVEILFDGLAAPIDMDLDLSAGLVYWTNRGDNTVNRAPLDVPAGSTPTTRTDRQIIVPNVTQAIGIALDHERSLVYYTDAVGDVGQAALDGTGAKFLLTKSGAFTGIVIVDLPK
jgi:hypothetical protein